MEATYPVTASSIKKGQHIVLGDHPCKIIEFSHSKTGKHGGIKVNLVGLDIFDGTKKIHISAGHDVLQGFDPIKKEFSLVDVNDGYTTMMDERGNTRSDLKINDEGLLSQILDAMEEAELIVITLSALGREEVISFKKN